MERLAKFSLSLILVVIILHVSALSSVAETLNCTPISSLPTTIKAQGVYCLQKKLAVSMSTGAAISIKANNVTIDLNGYTIVNKKPNKESTGIEALDRHFITIKNGVVRNFAVGVALYASGQTASRGHIVEDLRIDKSYQVGLIVQGSENMVRRNWVMNSGPGCVPLTGCWTYGIEVGTGKNIQVNDNVVSNVRANGSGYAYGIMAVDAANAFVTGNRISDSSYGVGFAPSSSGKYQDNLTAEISGAAYLPNSATDAGNNK